MKRRKSGAIEASRRRLEIQRKALGRSVEILDKDPEADGRDDVRLMELDRQAKELEQFTNPISDEIAIQEALNNN